MQHYHLSELKKGIYEDYFSNGNIEAEDLRFTYTGFMDQRLEAAEDKYVVAPIRNRLRYLRGKYKPSFVTEGTAHWAFGCLAGVGPQFLRIRASEWFRKLMSDLIYASAWTGVLQVKVIIEKATIRELELPLMLLWAKNAGVNFSSIHCAKAAKVLKRYSLEKTFELSHRSSRKYLLAYYYRTGEIDWKTYLEWRRK